MKTTITATPTTGRQLQPGDLFSTAGPVIWASAMDRQSIGERVYIRTNNPMLPSDADELVYKIEIVREGMR